MKLPADWLKLQWNKEATYVREVRLRRYTQHFIQSKTRGILGYRGRDWGEWLVVHWLLPLYHLPLRGQRRVHRLVGTCQHRRRWAASTGCPASFDAGKLVHRAGSRLQSGNWAQSRGCRRRPLGRAPHSPETSWKKVQMLFLRLKVSDYEKYYYRISTSIWMDGSLPLSLSQFFFNYKRHWNEFIYSIFIVVIKGPRYFHVQYSVSTGMIRLQHIVTTLLCGISC